MLAAVPFSDLQVIASDADDVRSVHAADLDRDGNPDVLAASFDDDTLRWYAGDGAGGFGPASVITSSADGARSVHAADLDRDGDMDVVLASFYDNTIAWYANDGTGVFGSQQVIDAASAGASSVFAVDLDKDGDADLLAASRNDDTIAWYANDGTGGFAVRQVIAADADGAVSVYAADVDRDGDQDVLSASFNDDTVAWYENDGTPAGAGDWTPHSISTTADGAYSVHAADVDRDGDLDVLSASANDDTIAWYVNNGSGGFGSPQVISTTADGATSVYAMDMDRDGDIDVVSAAAGDDTISWHENLGGPGTPGFGPAQIISNSADGVWSVLAADIDKDGDQDVLAVLSGSDTIAWFDNETIHHSANFVETHVIVPQADLPRAVFAADLDGDGDQDVLSASSYDDKIAWYENRLGEQTADFGPQQVITASANGASSVFTSDLDGDGDRDVLSASVYDDKIAWYENRLDEATGDFGPQHVITTNADGARSVFTSDLDGDGDPDVLSASSGDQKIAWYENRLDEPAADFGPQQVITTSATGAWSVLASDLDGDGDQDVLSASAYDDSIAWYENRLDEAAGDFVPRQPISTGADGARSVFVSDLDGDGDPDVLSASSNDDKIAWYENRLDEAASDFGPQQVITTDADGAESVFATDLDGDGDPDVLSASRNDDKIAWYENRLDDASGDFGPQQVITISANGAYSVFASDLDGDGGVDVLSASRFDDKIAWYENRLDEPAADFGPQRVITTNAEGAESVFAADLDGDGDPDVLSASFGDDKIAWYENRLDEASGDIGPQQVITTSADGALSVFAVDLDGDGDSDVLSASAVFVDGKIAWYENRLNEAPGDFGPQQVISTSVVAARSVFAVDLDGDGDPDVLSASYGDDKIAWYENQLNEASAGFGPQQVITTDADGARSVVAMDLDGDGDPDVLSASYGDDKIAWYENRLNDATSDFGPQQVITTNAAAASSVFMSDLDGDGDSDVLSASPNDDKIAWYENRLNEATGDFGLEQVVTTSADGASSVFTSDLDGDGDPDIISGSGEDDEDIVAWYENRLDELTRDFGPQQVISTGADVPRSVFASDLDGDGDPDVISASTSDNKIAWYENAPAHFSVESTNRLLGNVHNGETVSMLGLTVTHLGHSSDHALELASFDLLFEDIDGGPITSDEANQFIETLYVYRDVGSLGNFDEDTDTLLTTVEQLTLNNGVQTISISPGEPIAEVLGAQAAEFFIVVQISRDASVQPIRPFRITPGGDSEHGILARDVKTGGLLVPLFPSAFSSTSFLSALSVPFDDGRLIVGGNADGASSVYAVDLDGDGDVDALSASRRDGEIAWYENRLDEATGDFGLQQVITSKAFFARSVFATDLDGDGDADVLSASPGSVNIAWYENRLDEDAGDFGPQQVITTSADGANSVFALDLDGDGDADVLSASQYDSKIAWYENRLDEVTADFGPQMVISNTALSARSVHAADLDGDGDADVLSASLADNKIAWYENRLDEAAGDFGPPQVITTSADGAFSVFASDLDGDGDAEVLSASLYDDTIAWYENRLDEAAGDFGPQQVVSGAFGVGSVSTSDLDGDGDADLISAGGVRIAWYENRLGEPFGDFGSQQVIAFTADTQFAAFASDLDGDGDADILSASYDEDKIAWYENRLLLVTGDFGPEQVIIPTTSADFARSVFASDLDGDGDADVLSASRDDDKIAWYENRLGESTGDFGPQQVITSGADGAFSVFASDLDGDGDIDVLSASLYDDTIAWYENRLDEVSGDFGSQQVITTSVRFPYSVVATDLDGDGDADVLSASLIDDKVAWYENRLNEATADFGPQQVITSSADGAFSVVTTDLDGDGDADVLSASADDVAIAWYENRLDEAAGDFGPQQVVTDGVGVGSLYASDLDGDGDADVLSSASAQGKIIWYENRLGQATGDFGPQQVIAASAIAVSSVFTSDLDGDGDADVLSASASDDKIAWYANRLDSATGDFGPQQVISTSADGALSVFASDVDGDGDVDVLSASYRDDKIAWYENRSTHRSAEFAAAETVFSGAQGAASVRAGDLDGDGDLDLVSASSDDDTIAWYPNVGGGVFLPQEVITTSADGASSVHTADLDKDGDLDVLAASRDDDTIAWYENDGAGQFSAQVVLAADAIEASSVYAADLNRDGHLDVLSASFGDDTIGWYANDGSGGFGPRQTITSTADGAMSVYAADIDRDGDTDVLSASANDNTVAWYENDDLGGFGPAQVITSSANGAVSVFAADLDHDGDLDVLAAAKDDVTLAWYRNDGTGSFPTQHVIMTSVLGVTDVYAADVDRDGDLDVLSASSLDDTIGWHENNGNPAEPGFFPRQVISATADGAAAVIAADLDRDGNLDVVSASRLDDRIAWYENRGGQFALPTTDTAPGVMGPGGMDDLLRIDALHRGRLGDHDSQVVWFELLLEESPGDPLTSAEANGLIENLAIYRDDGSGGFDAATDTLVTTVDTLSLTSGRQRIELADGDSAARFGVGAPATFFVVVQIAEDLAIQPVRQFRVTHLTETSSLAEDQAAHVPLELEFAANVATSIVGAGVVGDMDLDLQVDVDDVPAFVLALVDPDAYQTQYGVLASLFGDVDMDGALDLDDVDDFVALLVGPGSGGQQQPSDRQDAANRAGVTTSAETGPGGSGASQEIPGTPDSPAAQRGPGSQPVGGVGTERAVGAGWLAGAAARARLQNSASPREVLFAAADEFLSSAQVKTFAGPTGTAIFQATRAADENGPTASSGVRVWRARSYVEIEESGPMEGDANHDAVWAPRTDWRDRLRLRR